MYSLQTVYSHKKINDLFCHKNACKRLNINHRIIFEPISFNGWKDFKVNVTSLYRKPIFTGLYPSWNSFGSKSRKINQNSECKLNDELKKITDIFLTNCNPESFIPCKIKFTISKFQNNKTFGPLKCPVNIKLLRIGCSSQFFADKISLSNSVLILLLYVPFL